MDPQKIKTIDDCQAYCEGVLNDLELGIIDKSEALVAFWEYTVQIHNLFTSNFEGRLNEKVREITARNKLNEKADFKCLNQEHGDKKCNRLCETCINYPSNKGFKNGIKP